MDGTAKPDYLSLPSVSHAEPVLLVQDIEKTVTYWKDIIAFTHGWTYGSPVNHGGVSWNGASFVQFAQGQVDFEKQSVWIRGRNIELLYKLHQDKGADITAPLMNMPWGFAQYTIKDLNGISVHFSAPADDRHRRSTQENPPVQIVKRKPTPEEMDALTQSIGWATMENHSLIGKSVVAYVAIDSLTDKLVGSVFLYGDEAGFYYIKNLIVDGEWQGRYIATSLMQALMDWINVNAPDGSTIGLFTGDHLAKFYQRFGFLQCCGMYQQIIRKPQ